MSIEIKWHGHNTWELKTSDHNLIIDPFFDDNPACPVAAGDVAADFILISHGHFDHIADAAAVANRTGATCIAIFEIAQWLAEKHQVQNTVGMNIGGSTRQSFGEMKLTQAWHSSQLPDGSYGGEPAGILLTIDSKKIYFACDTALFSDMEMIGKIGIDLAIVPIGDLFTMGPEDSVQAVKWINPRIAMPCHYNTWPPIEQDAQAWAEQLKRNTDATPVVLNSGESYSL
jgi:L-ascorbate metabolism protein UlaG (beta-lactamase superfamily)